jgi:hypothetical protein
MFLSLEAKSPLLDCRVPLYVGAQLPMTKRLTHPVQHHGGCV